MEWCGNVDHVQVALLTAVAGAGKSTVAHTIAHSCAKRDVLLSSFFFREGKTTTPKYLWSGVARSLAIRSKSYRQTLTSVLESRPSIATAAFDSGSLYSNLFVTDHPRPTAFSLLSSMPWTSVTRMQSQSCPNFLGTVFLSSLAASNSSSPHVRVVNSYFRSLSSIHRCRWDNSSLYNPPIGMSFGPQNVHSHYRPTMQLLECFFCSEFQKPFFPRVF
jgi:hypothetical protein